MDNTEKSFDTVRTEILEAVLPEFNDKGIKFTMDDIAKRMGMSKKTLYLYFKDKNALFEEMVDYTFCGIKREQEKHLKNPDLSIPEKLRKVMTALPEGYKAINLSRIVELKEKYPDVYEAVRRRIESDWEPTIDLLKKGMQEGSIRKINPILVKAMVEGTLEHILTTSVLAEGGLSYDKAQEEMMNILMMGLEIKACGA